MDHAANNIRITLLGDFRVSRTEDASPIAIKSKKGRALLAFLAMHLGRPVSRSRIAALLWHDQQEALGRQNLRQILTELRNEIGAEFNDGISKDAVQLNSDFFSVDAIEFTQLSRNPLSLADAVSLYAGDLTTNFDIKIGDFDDWLLLERRKLHNLAIEIFDAHIKALTDKGENKEALTVCERLIALDPLRESTHRLLLALDASVNGRASAIARAGTLKATLIDQLGVAPEPATLRMIEELSGAKLQSKSRKAGQLPPIVNADEARMSRKRPYASIAFAVLVLAGLGASLFYSGVLPGLWNDRTTTDPSQLRVSKLIKNADTNYSIAVLPFTARSDSVELKRFANSLEEDVIDSLSRAPRFLVISRQTSRSYRNTNKDAREIGKELNVEFLLSATVQTDGETLIIRAQLVDTNSGLLTWSDRFVHATKSNQEVFEEIVLGVARQLQIQVMYTEATKRAKLERNTPTYGDLIQRGWVAAMQSFARPESADHALQLFEQAIVLNPTHVAARVGVASILIRRIAELRSAEREKDLERAEALLVGVIKDRPENSTAHYFLGIVRKLQGRNADSVAQFEKAIRLNPSNPNSYAQLGHSLVFLGRAKEAGPYIEKAIRLSPRDPTISAWYLFAGQAELHLRNYHNAIRWLERSIAAYPNSGRTHLYMAAAYILKGDSEAAVSEARMTLLELPNFKVEQIESGKGDADAKFIAERERIKDAMREVLELVRKTK